MLLRSFAIFKLIMSRHWKELRGDPKVRGLWPWPIWPMRKSVSAYLCWPKSVVFNTK